LSPPHPAPQTGRLDWQVFGWETIQKNLGRGKHSKKDTFTTRRDGIPPFRLKKKDGRKKHSVVGPPNTGKKGKGKFPITLGGEPRERGGNVKTNVPGSLTKKKKATPWGVFKNTEWGGFFSRGVQYFAPNDQTPAT